MHNKILVQKHSLGVNSRPPPRYATNENSKLETKTYDSTEDTSSSESDKHEELIANPVILKIGSQRGNIDCGGIETTSYSDTMWQTQRTRFTNGNFCY